MFPYVYFLTHCFIHLSAADLFHSVLCLASVQAFFLTSKQESEVLSRKQDWLLVLIFSSLCISSRHVESRWIPPSWCAVKLNLDLAFQPRSQPTASHVQHSSLCSFFHRRTISMLIFLVGPMGYLLSLRTGLLLVLALPEVSIPILLSSSSQRSSKTF